MLSRCDPNSHGLAMSLRVGGGDPTGHPRPRALGSEGFPSRYSSTQVLSQRARPQEVMTSRHFCQNHQQKQSCHPSSHPPEHAEPFNSPDRSDFQPSFLPAPLGDQTCSRLDPQCPTLPLGLVPSLSQQSRLTHSDGASGTGPVPVPGHLAPPHSCLQTHAQISHHDAGPGDTWPPPSTMSRTREACSTLNWMLCQRHSDHATGLRIPHWSGAYRRGPKP